MNAKESDATINAKLVEWNITYKARYVGQVQRDKKWDCDQWDVTFSKLAGKSFRTDYYKGLGLRSKIKESSFSTGGKPVKPEAAGVLYSLLLDASEQSFSYWCGDLGYDTDSIKAFNTYHACERIGKELRTVFDREQRAELSKLLEDY